MNFQEPFGLPRGSVRAIITLALLVLLGVSLFVPVVPGAKDVLTGLVALAVMAVRDYFSVRQEMNQSDGPPLQPPA